MTWRGQWEAWGDRMGAAALFPLIYRFWEMDVPRAWTVDADWSDWDQVSAFSGCVALSMLVSLSKAQSFLP